MSLYAFQDEEVARGVVRRYKQSPDGDTNVQDQQPRPGLARTYVGKVEGTITAASIAANVLTPGTGTVILNQLESNGAGPDLEDRTDPLNSTPTEVTVTVLNLSTTAIDGSSTNVWVLVQQNKVDGKYYIKDGGSSPDLWATLAGDTGTTTADSPTDTATFAGGNGIVSSVAGDTITHALDKSGLTILTTPDPTADYYLVWDATTSTWKIILINNTFIGVVGSVWTEKISVDHTTLQAASTNPTVTIDTLAAGELILDAFMDTSTAIPGGDGFFQYDMDLNYNGGATTWVVSHSGLSAVQTANGTPGFTIGIGTGNWVTGTPNIDITVTADQNTSNTTGGTFDVYLLKCKVN